MAKEPRSRFFTPFLFTALLLSFACSYPARADTAKALDIVYGVGGSEVKGDNLQATREAAIADALVSAVSRELTSMLPPEILAGQFQIINESILDYTDPFVRDYKVLTESTLKGRHRVLVQATLCVDLLRQTLDKNGVRRDRGEVPGILVCVAEKDLSQASYRYWWGGQTPTQETVAADVVTRRLISAGLKVLVPSPGLGSPGYPAELSVTEAVALAGQTGADIVVTGLAAVEEAPNTMGGAVKSFRGVVELTAYRTDSGQRLDRSHHAAVAAGSDANASGRQALENAAIQAGDDLARRIVESGIKNRAAPAAGIELTVEGTIGHIASFVKFREALNNMPGVDRVQLKEMMADAAVIIVDYQGGTRALADALLHQNFEAFGINISETGVNGIRLRLAPL